MPDVKIVAWLGLLTNVLAITVPGSEHITSPSRLPFRAARHHAVAMQHGVRQAYVSTPSNVIYNSNQFGYGKGS